MRRIGAGSAFFTQSWRYGKDELALFGGRTSVLMMTIWGVVGLLCIRFVYPPLLATLRRVPQSVMTAAAWILLVFFVWNLTISGLAVARWSQRQRNIPPSGLADRLLDSRYPDDHMRRIYPHMAIEDRVLPLN